MHPSLTFDVIRNDHRERIENARLRSRHAPRRSELRRDEEPLGRPPDRRVLPCLQLLLAGTTTGGAVR
jgi:hypothetical protein